MKNERMKLLINLFLTFAKIGLFTFGGGYAMIGMMKHSCVENRKWITHDEMMNITVIAESTPGPIAINCATFVGYRQAGLLGAIVATVGMVLPAFILIFAVSLFLDRFLQLQIIANAFRGIRIAVALIVLDAGIGMVKNMQKKPFPISVMVCSFAVMLLINLFAWNFSSITLMLVALVAGLIFAAVKGGAKA